MIAARKMKKNHPLAVTCYTNVLLGVVSAIGIQVSKGYDYSFMSELSVWSWVLIGLAGLFTIFENTAKQLAFRYEEAAKLQKLAFLPNVWNFSADKLIIGNTFAPLQLVGFASLFAFYIYELISFYFFTDHSATDTDKAKDVQTVKTTPEHDEAYQRVGMNPIKKVSSALQFASLTTTGSSAIPSTPEKLRL